jgi:hypothetical protein
MKTRVTLFVDLLHAGFRSAYSLTLNMEAISSSQTLAGFCRSTWHYISEHRTLQSSSKPNTNLECTNLI